MEKQTLGKRLKYKRSLKGLTQEELSDVSSVGIRTIQRIEKEEVTPHVQTVKLLAQGLQVEIDELMVLNNPSEETIQKKWMLALHATPFLGFIIPFGSILFPLFLWIHKSNDNKTYDAHGRAIVNFHCSILLYFFVSLILFFAFPGYNYFLTGAIFLFGIIVTIVNVFLSINKGVYSCPISIPFIKPKVI